MTDIVNKNIDFYAGLLGSGHNSVLRDKLIDMLKQACEGFNFFKI